MVHTAVAQFTQSVRGLDMYALVHRA